MPYYIIFCKSTKEHATVKSLKRIVKKMGIDMTAVKEEQITEVPITRKAGGTFNVDCSVNGLALNMIFDTGASDVSISKVEADFMLKNNYLSMSDIKGKQYYQTADGGISEDFIFIQTCIKKVSDGCGTQSKAVCAFCGIKRIRRNCKREGGHL